MLARASNNLTDHEPVVDSWGNETVASQPPTSDDVSIRAMSDEDTDAFMCRAGICSVFISMRLLELRIVTGARCSVVG
jgi:hypothetical protein